MCTISALLINIKVSKVRDLVQSINQVLVFKMNDLGLVVRYG